ncbi:hypothetical protein [Halegenticoccus soli]|uniref:hypothetical protein n=1 Tax=Halegenticoccus soli TaxID=1985678 RepID=UPI000C6CA6DB|nr:hypothetical protein [Halegenticoccus soli]
MRNSITDDDEGKRVVDAGGDEIGRVVEVRHGTAYVDPDPGLTDTVLSKLGWSEADEDSYPLQEEAIETITDDEIRLAEL